MVALAGLLLIAATVAPAAAASPPTSVTTYGYGDSRSGYNSQETSLGISNVGSLHELWSYNIGGATISEPVMAAQVHIGATTRRVVFTGSENGYLYAIDAANGTLVWRRFLGTTHTSCGDMPAGVFGVSSTPVIDSALNELFVAGGNGKLYALKLSNGQTVPGWPQIVTTAPSREYVYSAITRGMNTHADDLYVELASYCDGTPYHGRIEEFSIAQHNRLATWYVTGKNIDGGGIWGQAGVAIDAQGHLFVATGNAMVTPENTGYAEAVVRLSPSLKVQSFHQPNLVGGDVDFGGTPMLFQPPGCPLELAVENKSGVLLLYDTATIGAGPLESLQVGDQSDWQFNAIPAYDPVTNMVYVADSSSTTDPNTSISYSQGLIAFQVKPDCTLDPSPAWSAPNDPGRWVSMSPPTVANGVVYYGNGFGNTLLAYDAATGAPVWDSGSVIQGGIWAAPLVANGRLYAGSWDGHLYAFRP